MSTSAENFHGLITRLQVVLSEIDYAQKACLQAGKMECQLLNHLFVVKTPVNMNELAKVLGVSHSRVTRIMDNLVSKKLVTRRPSEEDRRCWFAIITEKGKKLAENSQQTVVDQQKKIIEKLPAKDVDTVYKSLKAYIDQYEAVLAESYVEL
ncbi:MAG: MarR family transcriptional regulator [Candidatus Cloacimonetes bacterium]|nr:MarR family transcriptional regulator [Candidatus Cloacimonadota bacterium]NLK50150.1 MarR family transcriptional regulator [Candidatus Cloacimonadota bacterium]NLO12185.1 MarR family transcriptional regulator [Candidatus Cloacimonadota bacterium]